MYGEVGLCDDCGPLYDNKIFAVLTPGQSAQALPGGYIAHIHDYHCNGQPKGSGAGVCKRARYRGLRISLGCGRHTMPGWFCIDAAQHPLASRPLDMVSDVKKIDLPDGCAKELLAVHVFEHLYRFDCDEVIEEWKRLLQPNGKLALEMPDLLKACRNVLEGRVGPKHPDQLGMWALYGDPGTKDPLMVHRWLWHYKTIKPFLEQHGFVDVVERPTEWHLIGQLTRDFRVEARKG